MKVRRGKWECNLWLAVGECRRAASPFDLKARPVVIKVRGTMVSVLFLHGWRSVVGGRKPSHLVAQGLEVLNPALPDDDFAAAVAIAQDWFDRHRPRVIVGSSRGGAVAMNLYAPGIPTVLLCPAWKRWGTATTVVAPVVILHSRADDVIPFAESEELLRNSGLPAECLVEVGNDHRLAEPDALAAMTAAVRRFLAETA